MYVFIFLGTRGGDEGCSGLSEAGGVGYDYRNSRIKNTQTEKILV